MPRHKSINFEVIPDVDERCVAIKGEIEYFLQTHLRDIAGDGRVQTAQYICRALIDMLTETYNEIDRDFVRAV